MGADADARGARPTSPLKPQVVARHVNDLLADDAIVTTDSGTITTWAARHLKIRRGMKFSCSGNLATMAPGLPYANAAQVAYPDRQVVAFVGDGGFTMLMGEFVTAVKYKLPIKVDHHQEQHARPDQVGADGLPRQPRVRRRAPADRLRQVRRGLRRRRLPLRDARRGPARRSRRRSRRTKPAIVEAVVDPFEPPMPARATPKQALHLAESLARGEPNRVRIATTIFRDKVNEFFQ